MGKNFDECTYHSQKFDEQNFDKLIVSFKGEALREEGW